MSGIITVTAYRAFGSLHVLITEHHTDGVGRSYRLVANEQISVVDTETGELADDLSQLGVVVWQAAERVAAAPF
jgi:hypothetical protein